MRAAIRTSCFRSRRCSRLADDGTIGGLGRNAYTFMGGIYSSRKVTELVAPAIAERLARDEVDLALFVPV